MKKPTSKERITQAEKDIKRIKRELDALTDQKTIESYQNDGIDINDIKTALETCLYDAYRVLEQYGTI